MTATATWARKTCPEEAATVNECTSTGHSSFRSPRAFASRPAPPKSRARDTPSHETRCAPGNGAGSSDNQARTLSLANARPCTRTADRPCRSSTDSNAPVTTTNRTGIP